MIRTLALLLMAMPATAEEVSRHRDWSLDCRAEAPGQTSCVLAQRLISPEGGAEIAQIILRAGADRSALVMRVPTGVDLTQMPAFRVDDGDSAALRWTACDAQFCLAAAPLEPAQITALRGGITATFGYKPLTMSQPILFDVSLLGISAGLDALGAQ